ncbi:serine/threonine-protein kinase [bacterium]|nr:serine/threonine-protein kinase [bacterium]QQR58756.1 MAG: serine/threonine-protein kinase [Candidatus Melainabacteria bacterium]
MAVILVRNDKLGNGHYTVVKELGVGGMGVVYQCRDEFLQRDVAIKILRPELMADPKNLDVFKEEARLVAHLEHPNIVTIFDIGEEEKGRERYHYLAMEYLPGGNLANYIQQSKVPLEQALNWMKQLANGLFYAHKKEVVHQDIKADNIFITTEGDLKIGDFGLARLMANRIYVNPTIKGMGTPAYMSPELCKGEQQDLRSDIYSMGVLFFEILTGNLPYRANGMVEMAMKHTSHPIPSVRQQNAQIPLVVDKMVMKMMEKMPGDRYQTLLDVISIIDDIAFQQRILRMGLKVEPQRKSEDKPANFEPPKSNVENKTESKDKTAEKDSDKNPDKSKSKEPLRDPLRESIKLPQEIGPVRRPSMEVNINTRVSGSAIRISQGLLPLLQEIWKHQTAGPIGWHSRPVVNAEDQTVYLTSTDGSAYRFELEGGKLNWKHDSGSCYMASPVLKDTEIVLATVDGHVQLLDIRKKKLRWQRKFQEGVVGNPVIMAKKVLIANRTGDIHCLNRPDGSTIWTYSTKGVVVGNLALSGDLIFVSTRGGKVICVDTKTGHKVWSTTLDGTLVTTPATSIDSIYLGSQSGMFYALSIETGQILWEYQTGKEIISSAQIIFTSVVFSSYDRWLYCCEKYDGTLRWKAPLKGRVQADLSVIGQTVVAASKEGWLQGFDVKTGELLWQRNFERGLESTPVFTRQGLLLAAVDGSLSYFSF